MMYDPTLVQPMREELTGIGFTEMTTPEEVDALFGEKARNGTTLLVVNSVCGCAARNARPAVTRSLSEGDAPRPDHLLTVFAGQDAEATERARAYMPGIPPSSPSMFLVKDGQLVFVLHRQNIQGREADEIAGDLAAAYGEHCAVA
jgi:putative YphP/YqiW family bacilliredoxin